MNFASPDWMRDSRTRNSFSCHSGDSTAAGSANRLSHKASIVCSLSFALISLSGRIGTAMVNSITRICNPHIETCNEGGEKSGAASCSASSRLSPSNARILRNARTTHSTPLRAGSHAHLNSPGVIANFKNESEELTARNAALFAMANPSVGGSVNGSQLSVTREIGVNDSDQAWCRGNLRCHNGMHSQL